MNRVSIAVTRKLTHESMTIDWTTGNEVTVLFGPSGAGKTMTMKMLAGLENPDRGSIHIDKDTVFDSTRGVNLCPQKRRIGYVFQQAALFPHMTVEENVAYGTGRSNWRRLIPSVQSLLQAVRAHHLAHRHPSRISGGESQRVALARALAGSPRLLLLDEPFSALDGKLRREMGALLLSLHKRFSVPVILVTHDPEEARVLGDRIIHYSGGRTIDLGAGTNLTDDYPLPAGGPPALIHGPPPAGHRVSVCPN